MPNPSEHTQAFSPAATLAAAVARLRASDRVAPYRTIVLWWAGSRALVLACAVAVQQLEWPRGARYSRPFDDPFAVLTVWDGRWYKMVAEHGYLLVPGRQSDPAFFPLYPVLMNGLGRLGLSLDAAGLLLAHAGFLLGLLALYELVRLWLPEADARRAAIYAAVFPFGFVFSMVYPESVVLVAMALAGVLAVHDRWGAAAVATALATLGRPEGFFLFVPLAVLAVRRWPALDPRRRAAAITAVASAPAAVGALALYHWRLIGDPTAFSTAQRAWGRWTSFDGPYRAAVELIHAGDIDERWLYRDAAFLVVYVACLALALRAGVPASWVLAGGLIVLLPLASGSVTSIARFGLLALPVYCGLAWLGRRLWIDRGIRILSLVLLSAGTTTILLHWP